jgi:hypothetical protein
MKIFPLLVLLLCYHISSAQPEKEVEMAVEKLRVAMIDPTLDGLKSVTSTNLTYGHSSGTMENQTEFVEALVSGKSDFRSIIVSDQTITLPQKDLALVRHKLKGETLNGGTAGTLNLGVLLVWMKEKGEWRLLARQAFKL